MMVMLNAKDVVIPMACAVCDAYIHEIGENPKCRYTKEIMRWYNFDPEKHRMYKCPFIGVFEEGGGGDEDA